MTEARMAAILEHLAGMYLEETLDYWEYKFFRDALELVPIEEESNKDG